jgi:hypothetical protein
MNEQEIQDAKRTRQRLLEQVEEMDYAERRYLQNAVLLDDPHTDGIECETGERRETSLEESEVDFRLWEDQFGPSRGLDLGPLSAALRDPFSLWRPWSGKGSTILTHDIVCLHTMVGTLAGSWSWASGAGRAYWHYGVNAQGTIWQCHDLKYRSAANLNGNWHVIPIETSDIDEGVFSSTWQNPLWTTAQVNAIVKLVAWLCIAFDIPPVLVPDTCRGRRGIAYHRQGIEPGLKSGCEKWSNANGKTCPANRVQQIPGIVARVRAIVLGGGTEGGFLDMLTEAQQDQIFKEICGNPETSRLGEVVVKVRQIADGGFFAYRDNTPDHVYWIFSDKSGRLKMLRENDSMRDWLAFTAGYRPVDMNRTVMDGIPVVGESAASKAAGSS